MKRCPNCQMIVDDAANNCPNCGYSFYQKVTNPFVYAIFILSVIFLLSIVLYSLLASTIEQAIVNYNSGSFYESIIGGHHDDSDEDYLNMYNTEEAAEAVVEIADSAAAAVEEDVAWAAADAASEAAEAPAEAVESSSYDNDDIDLSLYCGTLGDVFIDFTDGTVAHYHDDISWALQKKSYNKYNHELVIYAYNIKNMYYEGKFVGKYENGYYTGIFTDKNGNTMSFNLQLDEGV